MNCHLLPLQTLRAFSTSWSLRTSQTRGPIYASGTRRARNTRWTLCQAQTQLCMVCQGFPWFLSEWCCAFDSTCRLRRSGSARRSAHTKVESHPFTFLSLRSFGTCNPVKPTVTLHQHRRTGMLDFSCGDKERVVVIQWIPWGQPTLLFQGCQGPQEVQCPPGIKKQDAWWQQFFWKRHSSMPVFTDESYLFTFSSW